MRQHLGSRGELGAQLLLCTARTLDGHGCAGPCLLALRRCHARHLSHGHLGFLLFLWRPTFCPFGTTDRERVGGGAAEAADKWRARRQRRQRSAVTPEAGRSA